MIGIDVLRNIALFMTFLLLLPFFKDKIWAAIIAFFLSSLLFSVLASLDLNKKIPFLFLRKKAEIDRKEVFSFAMSLFLIGIINVILQNIDVLMIGFLRSPREVGIYAPAFSISLLVFFPLTMFSAIFSPIVADYYHASKINEFDFLFKTITRWAFTLSFPIFLFILL